MGLMNKLKNILFEEEEVEIPVIEKKEVKVETPQPTYKPMPVKSEVKTQPVKETSENYNNYYDTLEPVIRQEVQNEQRYKEQYESPALDSFKSGSSYNNEKTFNFPDFDEEEFESVAPPHRSTNVMEYEKKKVQNRKPVVSSPVSAVKKEVKKEEAEDKAKFKPSPIISPVYGILDKNYTPEDITARTPSNSKLDVDSVRKKAFGTLDTPKRGEKSKKEEQIIEDKILEEKLEKARTIDELLKDSSDEVLEIDEPQEVIEDKMGPEEDNESFDEVITSLDELDNKKEAEVNDEATLESDLFDLIDSMYENREDGE